MRIPIKRVYIIP